MPRKTRNEEYGYVIPSAIEYSFFLLMHTGYWTCTRKTLEKQKEVGKGKKTTREDWLVGWYMVQEWGLGTPNYHVMEDESEVVQGHIWTNRRNQLEDITRKWSGDLTFECRRKYKVNSGSLTFCLAYVLVRTWWLSTDTKEHPRKGKEFWVNVESELSYVAIGVQIELRWAYIWNLWWAITYNSMLL